MINPEVLGNVSELFNMFTQNKPFKHVVIPNFLINRNAEKLVTDFPKFDESSIDEFGNKSLKHVESNIKTISPFYKKFYNYISSSNFLSTMSEITGIPDLLFDTTMYGGGTHNNLHGQKLDVHVDFNYDQQKNHRRLNILLYLNKEWEVDWGGCIELHSNPRCPEEDEVITENVLFNKCLIFETNEYSWHGFKEIKLPENKQHLSRKCISIYLYTKTRPQNEIFAPHGTKYIQYPPDQLCIGQIIDDRIHTYIKNHITERDRWIAFYQKETQDLKDEIQKYNKYAIKTIGYIELDSITNQLNGNWLGTTSDILIKVHRPITTLTVTFYLPEHLLYKNNKNHLYINDTFIMTNLQTQDLQQITFQCEQTTNFKLTIQNENLIDISPTEIYGCLLVNIMS
jgi:hypothetical protein